MTAVGRPAADVVVPFRGPIEELEDLRARLGRLKLREGDSVVVVDNTPGRDTAPAGDVPVIHASDRQTPSYARNRGVERGRAPWLVFVDADVVPVPDLLDRYFESPPGDGTALLAGGISDEAVPPDGPAAARYAYLRGFMSQDDTLREGRWGFPKTANLACRRAAFEAVGGFRDDIRAGEDADLTYRLKAAGWALERREAAVGVHRNRTTVRAFFRQKLSHGSGMGWVQRQYPGASIPRRLPGLLWWAMRHAARRLARSLRTRDRDEALWALLEPLELVAHELGRWLPNERAGASRRRDPARR